MIVMFVMHLMLSMKQQNVLMFVLMVFTIIQELVLHAILNALNAHSEMLTTVNNAQLLIVYMTQPHV
jgi:hypothetical protein